MRTTILVAEDDRLGALLARQVLGDAGWSVDVAVDGDEAIERLRAAPERYALALLDLVMPGADITEVIDAAQRLRPALPVVLTSGYPEDFVRERLRGRTIDGFVSKPWEVAPLLATLRRALDARPAGCGQARGTDDPG
ncbi:MAG: response regulator [Lautropia sp.]